MIIDDNKLVIIFNGEIYNHIEIRKQLEKIAKIILNLTLILKHYFMVFTVKKYYQTKWNFLILHL